MNYRSRIRHHATHKPWTEPSVHYCRDLGRQLNNFWLRSLSVVGSLELNRKLLMEAFQAMDRSLATRTHVLLPLWLLTLAQSYLGTAKGIGKTNFLSKIPVKQLEDCLELPLQRIPALLHLVLVFYLSVPIVVLESTESDPVWEWNVFASYWKWITMEMQPIGCSQRKKQPPSTKLLSCYVNKIQLFRHLSSVRAVKALKITWSQFKELKNCKTFNTVHLSSFSLPSSMNW